MNGCSQLCQVTLLPLVGQLLKFILVWVFGEGFICGSVKDNCRISRCISWLKWFYYTKWQCLAHKAKSQATVCNTSTHTAMFTDCSGFPDTKIDKQGTKREDHLVLQGSNTLTWRCLLWVHFFHAVLRNWINTLTALRTQITFESISLRYTLCPVSNSF